MIKTGILFVRLLRVAAVGLRVGLDAGAYFFLLIFVSF
jgi:hypothetical protein